MSGRTCPRKDPRLLLCDETLNKLEGTISMLASKIASAALFTAICKASSDSHFAFLQFFFLGIILISTS